MRILKLWASSYSTHMYLRRYGSSNPVSEKHSYHKELSSGLDLKSWNSNKANVMYTPIFSTYVTLRVELEQIRWMNERWSRCSRNVSWTVQSRPTCYNWNLIPWKRRSGLRNTRTSAWNKLTWIRVYITPPPRQQESGGPDPMEICHAESKRSRITDYRDAIEVKRQEIMHKNVVLRTRYLVPHETVTVKRTRSVQGVGPILLRSRNIVADSQERSGSEGAEHPTDLAKSIEFSGLLTRVSSNTQSLYVTASRGFHYYLKARSGNDNITTIPSRCSGVEQRFTMPVLEESKHNFIKRKISPTRMTVRLATSLSLVAKKRVVRITNTLQEVQYDEVVKALDLDEKFDVILGLPWLRRYEPQVS